MAYGTRDLPTAFGSHASELLMLRFLPGRAGGRVHQAGFYVRGIAGKRFSLK